MKTIFRLLLVLLAAVFFLPTLATILLSFLSDGSIQLSGYDDLFFDCFIFYKMFWNSVLYAYSITLLQLVVILPAAFFFKRLLLSFYFFLVYLSIDCCIIFHILLFFIFSAY